jgi:FixJ family two-component response regulator
MARRRARPGSGRKRHGQAGPGLSRPVRARDRNDVRPVVGMGASAGGLEAFTRFFQAMSPDSGMAFVLIQHLDPTHQSLTAELLGKHTRMPVRQVAGDTPVQPNHVYVIPPDKYMSIGQGVLRLTPPPVDRRGMRMAIDFFFRSLADDRQERAIGILLSGMGTDGTLGLKQIRMVGGMAIAQDPGTALHGGMPQSAIANDAVDYVLPVEKMPEALLKYARHPYVAVDQLEPPVETSADDLTRILAVVRARLRFDFSGAGGREAPPWASACRWSRSRRRDGNMAREAVVYVIDDDAAVRRSLTTLGRSHGLVVEAYASGREFLAAYDPGRVGCLLLDVRLGGESGLDVQDRLRRRGHALPIIVLTGHGDVATSVRAFRAGAIDFLEKPVRPPALIRRIREALRIDRERRRAESDRESLRHRFARLSVREQQVARQLVDGRTSKEIARSLGISRRTVEGHRHRVLEKMEIRSAVELAAQLSKMSPTRSLLRSRAVVRT